jgi:hypothetical protein
MTDETDEQADNAENEYSVFFSLRMTPAQKRKLGADAGSMTLGQYVRHCLFETPTPQKRVFRRPVQDEAALSAVLDKLGRSRISSNLNQLAKAVHSGSLPVSPETEKALIDACFAVQKMGKDLSKSLGLPEGKP